jgi:hypothetical protein
MGFDLTIRKFDHTTKDDTCFGLGLPVGILAYRKYQFGMFWRAMEWKMLACFMDICLFCGHLVYIFAPPPLFWSKFEPQRSIRIIIIERPIFFGKNWVNQKNLNIDPWARVTALICPRNFCTN